MLHGITVLDLSSVGPASRASRWLADYGARVTKVKPADPTRQITPPFYAYSAHRGMDEVAFDLPADAPRFLELAASADVIIESFRPGVVDKLGVGYPAVSAGNPGIVYCSTTGFGQTGPRSQWAG
ncbi:MAG: CoA transferase, partial [Actinobacteria bacterium]|nr:CoA transferase [Actinomycetota bacterium]